MKEKYYCKYKDHNDKMKDTVVVTHWAKKQFSVVALAYAQKFAYSMTKTELCLDDPDHPMNDQGYVDAKLEGVEMEFESIVYHRVKLYQKEKL